MTTASSDEPFGSPARWSALRAVLEEALEREGVARGEFVRAVCAGDLELESEVLRLLRHEAAAGETFSLLEAVPADAAPRRLGPYELLRPIGSGGMGEVFLARRADGAYQRRVAIKLIQGGLAGERVLERFLRERQVLANLEHPGIARLLEGGATEDGAPFLVMEFVEGAPIDRFCDAERLPIRARVELLLVVCEAVEFAHRNLVVHRDLKPRNILVTAAGEPKLLDFGIAKVLDPEKASATPEVTVGVMRFMTPAYASPEQVAGRPVTTASDVYSLGVVLFELLTGELPLRVETTSAAEIERIVCDVEPLRPSAALRACDDAEALARARTRQSTPRALVRDLQGDLDRIVLKALRKEPRQRYAGVAELAADLRRHLDGRPVLARPDTATYRAVKFARRHRVGVTAAGTVLAALVGGLVLSVTQYRIAEAARSAEHEQRAVAEDRLAESEELARQLDAERAVAQARVAEMEALNAELGRQRELAQRRFADVRGFATSLIFDLHGTLFPLAGTTQAQELVVSTGLAYLDGLAAESSGDPELQREVLLAYCRMAEIEGAHGTANLGRLERALTSADKAVDLATEVVAAEPDRASSAFALGHAHEVRGNLRRAAGRLTEALEDFRAGAAAAEPFAHRAGAPLGIFSTIYGNRAQMLEMLQANGADEEVAELLPATQAALEALHARLPGPTVAAEIQALSAVRGHAQHVAGDTAGAEVTLTDALYALEDLADAHPGHALVARKARVVRGALAALMITMGRGGEALELVQQNLAELRAAIEADPADSQAQYDRLVETRTLMRVHLAAKEWGPLLELGEAELPAARERVERNPENAADRVLLGALLCDVGLGQSELGLPIEAGQTLAEAREVLEGLEQAGRADVQARCELARVYVFLGDAEHRAGASGTLRARHLSNAIDWFGRALGARAKLQADGVVLPVDFARDLDGVQSRLDACRADLERFEAGDG